MLLRFGHIEFDTDEGEFRIEDGRYHGDVYYKTLYKLSENDPEKLGKVLKDIFEEGKKNKAFEVNKALMIYDHMKR